MRDADAEELPLFCTTAFFRCAGLRSRWSFRVPPVEYIVWAGLAFGAWSAKWMRFGEYHTGREWFRLSKRCEPTWNWSSSSRYSLVSSWRTSFRKESSARPSSLWSESASSFLPRRGIGFWRIDVTLSSNSVPFTWCCLGELFKNAMISSSKLLLSWRGDGPHTLRFGTFHYLFFGFWSVTSYFSILGTVSAYSFSHFACHGTLPLRNCHQNYHLTVHHGATDYYSVSLDYCFFVAASV